MKTLSTQKQRKFQLNREKSYGENKCSVMTEWRMRQRPCGREDLTSRSLGRNIKMVSSVLKTRTEGKQNSKALNFIKRMTGI